MTISMSMSTRMAPGKDAELEMERKRASHGVSGSCFILSAPIWIMDCCIFFFFFFLA